MNNRQNAVTGARTVERDLEDHEREYEKALRSAQSVIARLQSQRDELLAALKAIGQALPKDPKRDRYGRTITDWNKGDTEPLRHLAIRYDIDGSYDVPEQVGQVARATIANAEGK